MSKTHNSDVTCHACSLNLICLPQSLTLDEIDLVDSKIQRGRPVQRNKSGFEEGQKFTSLYAIRSGAIKAYSVDKEGGEQIIGFYLSGELFGLDAIHNETYVSSAKALETSAVCELPFRQISELSSQIHLYKSLSKEISKDQQFHRLLSKKTAEERIASCLHNLSERYQKKNLSPTNFRLPMSRTDIGNYLGLAVETVSRVFTRLQQNETLKVDGKELQILDFKKLCNIAHTERIH
jgi:CRP/FNR family transcriptional regulator